jgi:hypothetical protein
MSENQEQQPTVSTHPPAKASVVIEYQMERPVQIQQPLPQNLLVEFT